MKTPTHLLASLAVASLLTGCISYRLVDRTETGSTYALYSMDREVPDDLKKEVQVQCGGPAKVVHEGEVPIGEVSHTNSASQRSGGVRFGSSTTDTTQKTEWRVTFECEKSDPNAAASAAPIANAAPAAE